MIRLCNPAWEYGYFAYIVGRKEWYRIEYQDYDLLILKLKAGTKWALHAGSHRPRATDWDDLVITGLPGPAVEYLTTIFTKLIFKGLEELDDDPNRPAPPPADPPGFEPESSRRERHLRHLRTAWKNMCDTFLSSLPDDFEWITTEPWPSMDSYNIIWLDDEQKVAPPGTGKTTSIAAIVSRLSKEQAKKFLYLATTNSAANVAMLHLVEELIATYEGEENIPKNKIVRFLKAGYKMETLEPRIRPYCLQRNEVGAPTEEEASGEEKIRGNLLKHQIIVCTLDLAIMDLVCSVDCFDKSTNDDAWGHSVFDMLILDEAVNIDLPRTAVAMMLASFGQIVMLGDVFQLPAYITNPRLRRFAAEESAMQFFLHVCETENKTCCSIVQLVKNYRSRPALLLPRNRLIYHETPLIPRDIPGLDDALPEEVGLIPNNSAISFVHVEGIQERHGVTLFTPYEICATIEMVELLYGQGVDPKDIGIDATYSANSDLLLEQLAERFPEIKVGCTNVWQGDERKYMLISLTRSSPNEDACGQNEKLGFLSDLRRITVAVSRSKCANIFICNAVHHLRNKLIFESLRVCCRNRAWILPMQYGVAQYLHMRVCKGEPDTTDEPHDEPSQHFRLFQPLSA